MRKTGEAEHSECAARCGRRALRPSRGRRRRRCAAEAARRDARRGELRSEVKVVVGLRAQVEMRRISAHRLSVRRPVELGQLQFEVMTLVQRLCQPERQRQPRLGLELRGERSDGRRDDACQVAGQAYAAPDGAAGGRPRAGEAGASGLDARGYVGVPGLERRGQDAPRMWPAGAGTPGDGRWGVRTGCVCLAVGSSQARCCPSCRNVHGSI